MRPLRNPVSPLAPAVGGAPADPPRRALLVRLGWMLAGTLAMLISLMIIASQAPWTFGVRDALFWGAVALTGALRYLDVTRFHGERADGEPATVADLKRYLGGLGIVSFVAWLAAQAIQV